MLHDRKHHTHKHSFFQDKLPLLFNEVKSDHMTAVTERERDRGCGSATVSVWLWSLIPDQQPWTALEGTNIRRITYCRLAISFLMCTQQQPEQKLNKQKHHQNTNNISSSSSREHQLCNALKRAGLCDCVCKAAFQLKKQVELGMGITLPNRKMFQPNQRKINGNTDSFNIHLETNQSD